MYRQVIGTYKAHQLHSQISHTHNQLVIPENMRQMLRSALYNVLLQQDRITPFVGHYIQNHLSLLIFHC